MGYSPWHARSHLGEFVNLSVFVASLGTSVSVNLSVFVAFLDTSLSGHFFWTLLSPHFRPCFLSVEFTRWSIVRVCRLWASVDCKRWSIVRVGWLYAGRLYEGWKCPGWRHLVPEASRPRLPEDVAWPHIVGSRACLRHPIRWPWSFNCRRSRSIARWSRSLWFGARATCQASRFRFQCWWWKRLVLSHSGPPNGGHPLEGPTCVSGDGEL